MVPTVASDLAPTCRVQAALRPTSHEREAFGQLLVLRKISCRKATMAFQVHVTSTRAGPLLAHASEQLALSENKASKNGDANLFISPESLNLKNPRA